MQSTVKVLKSAIVAVEENHAVYGDMMTNQLWLWNSKPVLGSFAKRNQL